MVDLVKSKFIFEPLPVQIKENSTRFPGPDGRIIDSFTGMPVGTINHIKFPTGHSYFDGEPIECGDRLDKVSMEVWMRYRRRMPKWFRIKSCIWRYAALGWFVLGTAIGTAFGTGLAWTVIRSGESPVPVSITVTDERAELNAQ